MTNNTVIIFIDNEIVIRALKRNSSRKLGLAVGSQFSGSRACSGCSSRFSPGCRLFGMWRRRRQGDFEFYFMISLNALPLNINKRKKFICVYSTVYGDFGIARLSVARDEEGGQYNKL